MSQKKRFAPKTCNLRLTAIRTFLSYSAEEDPSLTQWCVEVGSIRNLKVPVRPIEYLQNDEMKALLASVGTRTKTQKRDRMLLIFEYDAALRVEELVGVRLGDIHIDKNTSFVTVIGKGNKMRNIPIMEKTVEHLKKFIGEYHPGCQQNGERPLFYSKRDGQPHGLSTDSIEKLLKKYAALAKKECPNIPLDISCHLIRKTRAMDLYQSGIPLTYVAQVLGHCNISTTSGFYAFATLDTLDEAFRLATPIAYTEEPKWTSPDALDMLFHL